VVTSAGPVFVRLHTLLLLTNSFLSIKTKVWHFFWLSVGVQKLSSFFRIPLGSRFAVFVFGLLVHIKNFNTAFLFFFPLLPRSKTHFARRESASYFVYIVHVLTMSLNVPFLEIGWSRVFFYYADKYATANFYATLVEITVRPCDGGMRRVFLFSHTNYLILSTFAASGLFYVGWFF